MIVLFVSDEGENTMVQICMCMWGNPPQ